MALEETFREFCRRDWERREPEGTVRLALVGLGGFASERALPGIADSTYCEPTALVTSSPDRATDLAAQYGVERILTYEEFTAGTDSDAYDAVYVATPNATHGEYVLAGADQGNHVICEKPLEVTTDRTRTLVEACADAEVTLQTAYRLQVEPTVRRARELIDEAAIGEVVQLHGSFSNPILETAGPDSWRLDPDLAGGGALVDLGIYPLNTSRYLVDSEVTSVNAMTHSSGPPFDAVDEDVALLVAFENGATASLTASFDAHASSRLEVIGTDGRLAIASPFGGVVPQEMVVESGDLRMEYTGPPVDEVREQFEYFGYCVLTGTEPEPDGTDGLSDLAIIEAAYESADTGRRIAVD